MNQIKSGCDTKQSSSILSPLVGSVMICSSRKSWAKVISDSRKVIDKYEWFKLQEDQSIPGMLKSPPSRKIALENCSWHCIC